MTSVSITRRPLHLLVVENEPAARRTGRTAALRALGRPDMDFAGVLRAMSGDIAAEVCHGADDDARLPDAAGLADYDGIVFSGSSLNLSDGSTPAVGRQLALMGAAFDAGAAVFGSCFGTQLASLAVGAAVRRNPRGREFGVFRGARLTAAGRAHPLLEGRHDGFAALTSHGDEVEDCPAAITVLAGNAVSPVQAVDIAAGDGRFWGVQYHPEFSLADIAVIARRRAAQLVEEGRFASAAAAEEWAGALLALDADPARTDLAEALDIPGEILDPRERRREIANWLDHLVRPRASARGRG